MPARADSRKTLPSGTVTLLFADIEGSTRLLSRLRSGFTPVRARLRELVRASARAHGGHEVDWAGDGVFLAFSRAHDGVLAAVDIQRALAHEPWPPDGVVRLRIGVHTGEPELGEEGYVGMDVVVASRLCSAAHGGQIVVTRATREFFDQDGAELSFRPLGSHRLKDVPAPEQVFQVVAPGVADGFAPLATLGGASLPALHHRLVGRREDLTSTLSLLARPEVRLVTITGPGGAGKSRLALEIAALTAVERPVHLVPLAPVSDDALVPETVAHALGVRATPGRPLLEDVADALAGTNALLFLDNFEHLAGAAGFVATLLGRAPDLDVLVTSRAPLRLAAEHVVPLQPLSVYDASTLFAELAAARGVVLHGDALPAVREICRRLDGLPLAIELVAARLAVLPPAQLLRALDEGLALDMQGPVDLPERQRTLRATIDWSYGLLTEPQRELHLSLAVFAGGCTLDDARTFAGSSTFLGDLESLVTGSLLRSDVSDGEVRLFMLETVREDALARLAAADRLDELRQRHAERFLELAVSAETALAGPDQAQWLERLERELDNVRAALDWCLTSGRAEDALRAVSALLRFWRAHGHMTEARRWLSLGLEMGADVPAGVRADALWTAAQQATAQSDWDAAVPLLRQALEHFRTSGRGRETVFALSDLGWIALMRDDITSARQLCEEALSAARELADPRALSAALNGLGEVLSLQGEHERALASYGEAVSLRRELGDPLLIADALYNLGATASRSGDLEQARAASEEALAIARQLGEALHIASAQFTLADLALREGEIASAEEAILESFAIFTELENERARAGCLVVLGGLAAAKGAAQDAALLLGAAGAMREGAPPNPFEAPILERTLPELEAVLGDDLPKLLSDGARADVDSVVRGLVAVATKE